MINNKLVSVIISLVTPALPLPGGPIWHQKLSYQRVQSTFWLTFSDLKIYIRRPCKGHRRVWLSFLAVNPPFFPSHWTIRSRLKALPNPGNRGGIPPFTSTSIPDLEFDVIPESFWRSFWAHFEHAYLKIALSEADERKMRIEQKALVLRVQIEVGHPGASSVSIKILSQSSIF